MPVRLPCPAFVTSTGRHGCVIRAPATDWADLSPTLMNGFHEGLDIGIDRRAPVDWALFERRGNFAYGGRIVDLTIDSGPFAPDSPFAKG